MNNEKQIEASQKHSENIQQEVQELQQQLVHLQIKISAIWEMTQIIGTRGSVGFRYIGLIAFWALAPMRWAKRCLLFHRHIVSYMWQKTGLLFRNPWRLYYWMLFSWLILRGRITAFLRFGRIYPHRARNRQKLP